VHDFLLLRDGADPGATVGVVSHGHHTDAWNAPLRAGLGKMGTWLGSALLDVPVSDNPGLPDRDETDRILGGKLDDVLTRVSRRFGANREQFSLDEVLLFDAWRAAWPVDDTAPDDPAAAPDEPWLVFGHTHVPLRAPLDPASRRAWSRYANSGAGIFYECVTGVEWDGRDDPQHPVVRLVAWRYADRDAEPPANGAVAWHGTRAIVREVLDRVPPSDVLQVTARGHARATAASP